MQCINPLKAGFDRSGDISYNYKKIDKELACFAFPCRKCLPCRLNIAREKAIRAVHEAKVHKDNIFLTLTYNDDHVGDGRLNYFDFQLFMKSLREHHTRGIKDNDLKKEMAISYMVTGEYGDLTKRPHWHAIIFNYRPADSKHLRTSDRGDEIFTSQTIQDLWGKGNIDFGAVTLESAGYVARYAAKKLTHGKDQEHDFHPIHKTSSKHAIGKRFIERFYKDIFSKGYVVLDNGEKAGIPRYYTDWLKTHDVNYYKYYLFNVKPSLAELAINKEQQELSELYTESITATGGFPLTKTQIRLAYLKQKFEQLQKRIKL